MQIGLKMNNQPVPILILLFHLPIQILYQTFQIYSQNQFKLYSIFNHVLFSLNVLHKKIHSKEPSLIIEERNKIKMKFNGSLLI